jgi:hypothetical protein
LKKSTKLAGLAAAATTALFGLGSLTSPANACGTAQGANNFPGEPSPVYTSGAPTPGADQSGYVGVAGTAPDGSGGYIQGTGSAGAGGVSGDLTASGTVGGQAGTVSVGNAGGTPGVCGLP